MSAGTQALARGMAEYEGVAYPMPGQRRQNAIVE